MSATKISDCAIVGAGPAGLTTAIYLARYRRQVLVFDTAESRASLIPKTHNYPGFPNGISGDDLLRQLRNQAAEYKVFIIPNRVERISGTSDQFTISVDGADYLSQRVVLATGLIDKALDLPESSNAIEMGAIRYCPICDGFEATDKRIAVVGSLNDASSKAKFLRTYSDKVSIISLRLDRDVGEDGSDLEKIGVKVFKSKMTALEYADRKAVISFDDGTCETFDAIYPVLGCNVRSELLRPYHAKHDSVGCLEVDRHQQTSVPGIYAVGDVVSDLHQIVVGAGHAALAATHIHNNLPYNFR